MSAHSIRSPRSDDPETRVRRAAPPPEVPGREVAGSPELPESKATDRLRMGSALRACQVASERCGRALPELSALEDGRVHMVSDALELSELCAQALGRALEGVTSPFLEDELELCSKVQRACAAALAGEARHEPCARACLDCAEWCDRVLGAMRRAERTSVKRSAA